MKLCAAFFFVAFFLSTPSCVHAADPPKEMTGLEWLEASAADRTDCLLRSMFVLTKNGVSLKQNPIDYEDGLEEFLRGHPELYTEDVTDILAKYIYEREPSTRPSFDKLRKKAVFASAVFVPAGTLRAQEPAKSETLKFTSGPGRCAVLELYTSEAESDCVPAEEWFSGVKDSPDLWKGFVPVSFHVDQWNDRGWKDKFTLKDFSRRLEDYARLWGSTSVYTPAVVVNGTEWSGWSRGQDLPLSSESAGILSVEISRTGSATVVFSPNDQTLQGWTAHGVIVGFNISSKIQEGENAGRKLKYDFLALGYQKENMRSSYGKFKAVLRSLSARKDIQSKRTAVIVWVTRQDNLLPVQAAGGFLPEA